MFSIEQLSIGDDGPAESFSDIGGGGLEIENEHVVDASSSANGGVAIQDELDKAASETGITKVIVPATKPDDLSGYQNAKTDQGWLLTSGLEIGGFTLLKFECGEVFLDNQTDDNIIKSKNFDATERFVYAVGDWSVILNGNADQQNRQSSSYPNYGIHLVNVERFGVGGFSLGPTNKWALVPEGCRYGHIFDVELLQDASFANQDGIHILAGSSGSHNIVVSNTTGTVGDDPFVVNSSGVEAYGSGGDIHNIVFDGGSVTNLGIGGLRTTPEGGNTIRNIVFSDLTIEGTPDIGCQLGWANTPTQPALDEHQQIVIDGCEFPDSTKVIQQDSPVSHVTVSDTHARFSASFWSQNENALSDVTLDTVDLLGRNNPSGIVGINGTADGFDIDGLTFEMADSTELPTGLQVVGTAANLTDSTWRDVTIKTDNLGARGMIELRDGSVTGLDIHGADLINNGPTTGQALRLRGSGTYDGVYVDGLTADNTKYQVVVESGIAQNGPIEINGVTFRNTGSTRWTVNSDGVVLNGVAQESANAEQPQMSTYRDGALVDFTDSGDGSGTGLYKRVAVPNGSSKWAGPL
ncbi:glycoside hydrolase family protein [Halorientalis persicus]|uniref:hypothetical protein n=1 Tax=Halorientalis persicus TaxID=1367881 RepID=UPI000B86A728|nr:hypothetical protein [Halorientalis persicus]